MNDIRLSKHWCREIEGGLPDCRLPYDKRDPVFLNGTRLAVDPVFCADCGTLSGYATAHTPFIFFICDLCVGLKGTPPGVSELTKKQMAERGLRVVPL